MAEIYNQSWKSCRYSLGDLDIDDQEIAKTNPVARLRLACKSPETEYQKIFKKEKIHSWYVCTAPDMVETCKKTGAYSMDGIQKAGGGSMPVVQLNIINPNEVLGKEVDLLGEEQMCTHCKFFKSK